MRRHKITKNMKKAILMMTGILAFAVFFVVLAGRLSVCLTDHLNEKYMPLYMENATGVTSPWYDNGYHIVDGRFIEEMSRLKRDEKSVISIGSSVCVIPFHDEIAKEDRSYGYRFMTCGNGCYRSDRILYQLLEQDDLIKDDDLIKLEISFSTFRDASVTITETMLDKWGKYRVVSDDGDPDNGIYIKRSPGILNPIYSLNKYLIRIQSVWDLAMDYKDQLKAGSHGTGLTERAAQFGVKTNGTYDDQIIPGNFRNNYYNPDAVADTLDITDDIKNETEQLITDINRDHNLIVEISPMPPNLDKTEFGRKFREYVDDRLIPYLNANGISYVDYRDDYMQNEYADGVHLGYDAGIRYTNRIMEDINEYAGKIAGSF